MPFFLSSASCLCCKKSIALLVYPCKRCRQQPVPTAVCSRAACSGAWSHGQNKVHQIQDKHKPISLCHPLVQNHVHTEMQQTPVNAGNKKPAVDNFLDGG
jgi:hypothetical protein